MRHFIRCVSIALVLSMLTACATKPEQVSPSYVSPMAYQSYTCDQVIEEYTRNSRALSEVTAAQAKARRRDSTGVALGIILAWPFFFMLMAGDREAELARLKGEKDALEQQSIKLGCTLPVAAEGAADAETKDSSNAKPAN